MKNKASDVQNGLFYMLAFVTQLHFNQ